jgi:DNA adenine methylase
METFLKWAGGKRWLIKKADHFLPKVDDYNRYCEPFLGGGSIFFHVEPKTSLLSDVNHQLINTYVTVRDSWEELQKILTRYQKQHSKEFYYKIRASKPKTNLTKAAQFIYLNRTCWNGLYRVNKNGQFNVPIGTKTNVVLDSDNFEKVSLLLKQANIEVCDFEVTINRTEVGDFLFIDPPYTVKHNLNGFVKYNENIFSWQDQIRLQKSVRRAIDRGVNVLITNANHSSILELYNGFGEISLLKRASVIAGSSQARGIYSELLIKSW